MRLTQQLALLAAGAACALGGAAFSHDGGADAASSNQKVYNAIIATARNTSGIQPRLDKIERDLSYQYGPINTRLDAIHTSLTTLAAISKQIGTTSPSTVLGLLRKICEIESATPANTCNTQP